MRLARSRPEMEEPSMLEHEWPTFLKFTLRMSAILLLVVVCRFAIVMSSDMELLLVHTIWRHGDRSPVSCCPTDPFQEGNWTFGGGGFGQLSPVGMKQHFEFGKFLRKVYVDDMKFLSPRYSSKEIYIRSTDKNRTIISAMSNILGMYGKNDGINIPGEDYPKDSEWPAGFVPVAIHSVEEHIDFVANPDLDCNRQDILWSMANSSSELQAFQNRPEVVALLRNLTENCGDSVDIDNLWIVRDSLLVERNHYNGTLRETNKWFSDDLFDQITTINQQVQLYKNGVFNEKLVIDSLDIGLELKKIRGGPIFDEINTRMNNKLDCLNKTTKECKWINGLKYYAYSAHDTTIYAVFSIMGIQSMVVQPAYPEYAAATFIELWLNRTDGQPYFKMTYRQSSSNTTLYPITTMITGCNAEYCSLDVFRRLAHGSRPDLPMEQWCDVDPRKSSSARMPSSLALLAVFLWIWRAARCD